MYNQWGLRYRSVGRRVQNSGVSGTAIEQDIQETQGTIHEIQETGSVEKEISPSIMCSSSIRTSALHAHSARGR